MKTDYSMRASRQEDMLAIQNAHRLSIQNVCSKDYGEKEIIFWGNVTYTSDFFLKNIADDCHSVVEVDEVIKGFCHSRYNGDGHGEIMGLFLTKDLIGKGIGRSLFNTAMDYLKTKNVTKVTITGTRTAKNFYEKMGFHATSDEKMFDIRGEKIGCYEMEMKI
jgi:putative acetyltransferase